MTEEKKQQSAWRHVFNTIALLLFLIILPGGSWYYLRTGLDYRKEALGELSGLGALPAFELYTYQGDTLRTDDLRGKLTLLTFPDLTGDNATEAAGDILAKLHEQFDERTDVVLLQHLTQKGLSAGRIAGFEQAYRLADPGQCYFITGGSPPLDQLLRDGYRFPRATEAGEANASPYLALADTSLTIRRFYDMRNTGEIKRLVAHIALLLPREKEEQPVLVREAEK